jgi:hypothetical protein
MSTVAPPQYPTIDLQLPSGLRLRNAVAMLAAKFAIWPWYVYDGVPLVDPDLVSDDDVDTSFQIGARTSVKRADYRSRVGAIREVTGQFLRLIPRDARLDAPTLDFDAMRAPVVGLFDTMTGVAGMKLGNASKIVHRHRPAFLPILDSVVRNYYWFAISLHDEDQFLHLSGPTVGWGEYAFSLMGWLRHDLLAVEPQLSDLRRAISDTPYSGASAMRILESLIWYYYAGR